ncbi:hypothetical protein H8959_001290 [Pygathrix nigripes]
MKSTISSTEKPLGQNYGAVVGCGPGCLWLLSVCVTGWRLSRVVECVCLFFQILTQHSIPWIRDNGVRCPAHCKDEPSYWAPVFGTNIYADRSDLSLKGDSCPKCSLLYVLLLVEEVDFNPPAKRTNHLELAIVKHSQCRKRPFEQVPDGVFFQDGVTYVKDALYSAYIQCHFEERMSE